MWGTKWLCLAVVAVSAVGGSGPEAGGISWELVQSLPPEIQLPAERIFNMLQVHPHLWSPLWRESSHPWRFEDIETLCTFLDHVEQVVEYAIRYPTAVSSLDSANERVPYDFESLHPYIEFIAKLFDLIVDPEYETLSWIDAQCVSQVDWEGLPSEEVLPFLRMLDVRIVRMGKDANQAIYGARGDAQLASPLQMSAHRLRNPWYELSKNVLRAVEPIIGLCRGRLPPIQELADCMSEAALSALQAQVDGCTQDAAAAFRAMYETIATLQKDAIFDETACYGVEYTMELIMDTLLPNRGEGILSGQLGAANQDDGKVHQVGKLKSAVSKFVLHYVTQIIKFGQLVPGVYYRYHTRGWNDKHGKPEAAENELKELQRFVNDVKRIETKPSLYKAGRHLCSQFPALHLLFRNIAETAMSLYAAKGGAAVALDPELTELFNGLYVAIIDILRILDQYVGLILGGSNEPRRHHLLLGALLPPQDRDGTECGLGLVLFAMDILHLLQGKVTVPEDCRYDLNQSPLMQNFPPITFPSGEKSANSANVTA